MSDTSRFCLQQMHQGTLNCSDSKVFIGGENYGVTWCKLHVCDVKYSTSLQLADTTKIDPLLAED